ncbi:MAG: hypothetical protein JRJ59_02480 [Deltaproteobacteria bacterium]|nr:hypothetical protein [Deltaproteobacteria bacterium]
MLWTQALGLAGLVGLAGVLSLAGALRPWPAGVALIGLAAWGLWTLRRGLGPGRGWLKSLSGWEKLFLAGLIFHQLVGLTQALTPPTSGEGLHALFVLAQDYGREGTVYYHPDRYASRPQNMVLLYSLVQLLARAEASQLVSWWFGLLSLLGLVAWGQREINRTAALLAGLVFSAAPLFSLVSGRGISDMGVFFFGLMGLWAVRLAASGQRPGQLAALAGLCLGLAAGFKVIGLTLLAAGLGLGLAELARRRLGLVQVLVLAGLGLAAAGPWYVYSYCHTGQILYNGGPLTGPLARADRARILDRAESGAEVQTGRPAPARTAPSGPAEKEADRPGALGRVVGPLVSEFWASLTAPGHNPLVNFWRLNTIGGHRQRVVSPFILALAPLLLLLRPVPSGVKWLVGAGLLQFGLASLIFGPYVRYGLVGLALTGLGAAWVWWSLVNLQAWPRRLALALLVVAWGALLPEAGYALFRDMPVAVGLQDRAAYLDKATQGEMEVYRFANRNLPPQARVLSIAEHRAYYLDREVVYGSLGRNPYLRYDQFTDWEVDGQGRGVRRRPPLDEQFDAAVRRLKVSHVLISRRLSDNAWVPESQGRDKALKWKSRIDAWAREHLEELFCRGDLCLYRLKARGEK